MIWWKRVLRWRRADIELDKELAFHVDQHATDLVATGHDPTDARRQARLALGGPQQVKEVCREARRAVWLDDLWQDGRLALRALRQQPAFAVVALLTLALGSGATTVMFAVVNSVLLRPLSYPHADRLITVREQTDKYGDRFGVSYPNFLDCQQDSRTLSSMAAWTYGGGIVGRPGNTEWLQGRQISSDLFATLGIPLMRGRAFRPEEDRPGAGAVIIISEGLWRRLYAGDEAAVGQSLLLEGRAYAIVGVAPRGFQLDGDADLFTPLGQETVPRMQNRQARFLNVWARLRPEATMAEARAELGLVGRRLATQFPSSSAGWGFAVQSLHENTVGSVRPLLWLLFGAVALVLLIACVNVASLLLARAVSRDRELAMRVALGATRSRLVRQCLTESTVLAVLGGIFGVLLALVGTRPFLMLWPEALPRAEEVRLDGTVLLFALGASVCCGVLFGLAPALRAPVRALDHAIRSASRIVSGSSRRLHRTLVVSEIALAIVLLVAAAMLGRALLRLSTLDPGINPRNVLIARLAISPEALARPGAIRATWQDVLDRARRVPGVESAALSDIIPMRVGVNALGFWTTAAPPPVGSMPIALASVTTPGHLTVMGIPLRRGRYFDERDRLGAEAVVVIDDLTAQHAFGGVDPVGKRLFVQAVGPSTVIGVVGHVRHWGLAADDSAVIRDQIYYPLAQIPDSLLRLFSSVMSFEIRTSVAPLNVIVSLRESMRGPGGGQTLYEVRTMEQLMRASLDQQRFLLLLFGAFAGLALLLACVGLYGVLAYLTSRRVPEIGVRMALGASARDIIWMVFRQSLAMIALGVSAGGVLALAASRFLLNAVQGVRPTDPMTFAIVIPLLVGAAVLASLLPARRASRVDPLVALRQE